MCLKFWIYCVEFLTVVMAYGKFFVIIHIMICFSGIAEFSWRMGEMSGFQLGVVGALFLSVASSVSIVICNKALMSNLGFPFGNCFWFLLSLIIRFYFFSNHQSLSCKISRLFATQIFFLEQFLVTSLIVSFIILFPAYYIS